MRNRVLDAHITVDNWGVERPICCILGSLTRAGRMEIGLSVV